MKRSINKSEFLQISISMICFICVFMVTFFWWKTYNEANWYIIIACLSMALLCLQSFLLIWRYKSVLTYEFIFVVLFHVFAFGRIYLMALGKEEYIFWDLMLYYSDSEKWQAGMLALCVCQGFVTGFLLHRTKKGLNKNRNISINNNFDFFGLSRRHMFYCGLLFFMLTEPITIYVAIKNIGAVQAAGRYADADVSGVIGCLSYVAPVGIIMMITSGYKKKKSIATFLLVYDLFSLIISTFTGDRRYVVTAILVTFLAYFRVYNIKIKLLNVAIYTFLGFFILAIINSIRVVRASDALSFSMIVENILTNGFDFLDTLFSSLAEFGITFFTYLEVVHYYPETIPFKYGITYLLGPITLIPGIGKIVPEISSIVSVPAPIEAIVNYSVGGSVGEELYGNFGYFGILLSVFMGYMLEKFMRGRMEEMSSGYQLAKYYIMFYFAINLVRATFNEMFRSITWSFAILYIVRMLVVKVIGKENNV